MTADAKSLEALADRILERMRGGPICDVSPEKSRAILVEEFGKLVAEREAWREYADAIEDQRHALLHDYGELEAAECAAAAEEKLVALGCDPSVGSCRRCR